MQTTISTGALFLIDFDWRSGAQHLNAGQNTQQITHQICTQAIKGVHVFRRTSTIAILSVNITMALAVTEHMLMLLDHVILGPCYIFHIN